MKRQKKRPVVYIELYFHDISNDDNRSSAQEAREFIDNLGGLSEYPNGEEEIDREKQGFENENNTDSLLFVKQEQESELEIKYDFQSGMTEEVENHTVYRYDFNEDDIPEIKVEFTDEHKRLIRMESASSDGNEIPYFIFKTVILTLSKKRNGA
jgi:hypothetical protein